MAEDREEERADSATRRRRRGPRTVTAPLLEKAALHYLERFASSSAHLKRVLMRRVARSARADGSDAAAGERLVDDIVQRYLRAGLLDDAAYAASQAASLRRRGASRHAIRGKLALKGIDAAQVEHALASVEGTEGSEIAAAAALARRRRLGPYRAGATRDSHRQKDLATLARAGFSLDLARRVLAAADPDALDALVRGAADEN
jgi:regulatory protein